MKNFISIKSIKVFIIFCFLFSSSYAQENWRNDYKVADENVTENKISLDNLSRTEGDYQDAIKQLKIEKLTLSAFDNQDRIEEIDDEIKVLEDQLDELKKLNEENINANKNQYLGTPVFDKEDFWKLIIKGLFNFLIILLIVRYIYYPVTKNKDYLFTYFLISLTVFLLCFLLDNVKLELGFALGLFAIFGIIRYRTDPIPIKEMTYLFIVIGVSVINALANKKISYAELFAANMIIVFTTFGLERIWLLRHETRKNITYEKIDLIAPERREELIADLTQRTGLNIVRVEIGRIDFLRDTANIRVFYYEKNSN